MWWTPLKSAQIFNARCNARHEEVMSKRVEDNYSYYNETVRRLDHEIAV